MGFFLSVLYKNWYVNNSSLFLISLIKKKKITLNISCENKPVFHEYILTPNIMSAHNNVTFNIVRKDENKKYTLYANKSISLPKWWDQKTALVFFRTINISSLWLGLGL